MGKGTIFTPFHVQKGVKTELLGPTDVYMGCWGGAQVKNRVFQGVPPFLGTFWPFWAFRMKSRCAAGCLQKRAQALWGGLRGHLMALF